MADTQMSRRRFFRTSVLAAAGVGAVASAGSRVLGANGSLQVGFIGPGGRGLHLLRKILEFDDVRIVAVADTYTGWLARAAEAVRKKEGRCREYPTGRALLEDRHLDAVVIATPEHSHASLILDSLSAGLDVFCEKPMVHTWQEAVAVMRANEAARRIIQVGTQRRSSDIYPVARDIIQSGKIGRVTEVRAWWNRNSDEDHPQWRYVIPEDASPVTCNWEEWLCDAPRRPFSKERYFQWRCYWDYSGGIGGDLMVHQLDAINMVMGSSWPVACFGTGRIYRWNERDRETPDTWNAVIEHPAGASPAAPEGFMINYSSTFSNEHYGYAEQFLGTDGTIEMNDRLLKVFAEPERMRSQDVAEMEFESKTDHTSDNLRNFFDCCRSRQTPNCSERDGAYAAATAHLTVLSHFAGRRVQWDPQRLRPKV